jgi:acetylornithine deacetylase
VVEGGVSFLPNKRLSQIREEMRHAIESEAGEWAKANYRLTFERLHNDAYETPVNHPAVQTLCAAADSVRGCEAPTGFPASCDARLFWHEGKIPTIVCGPGEIGHAHSDNEQISMAQIARAAEILARFLVDWCGRQ